MKKKTLAKILPWIIVPLISIGVAKCDLGNKIFKNSYEAKEQRAAEYLGVNESDLYITPGSNYYVLQKDLSKLLMLAAEDTGENSFDPNTQIEELSKTCKEADYNQDKILTLSEIEKSFKDKYDINFVKL